MVRVYPPAGTVFGGMGTEWEKLTCSIPVLNPKNGAKIGAT